MMRALEDGEAAGHLAHRCEQRQAPVCPLHRLVRDGDDPRAAQRRRERGHRGQVQIGEEDLPAAEPRILLFDRLLDLQDHLGGGPDLLDGREPRADLRVLVVAKAAARARVPLDGHPVAGLHQRVHPGRRGGDPLFPRLDLPRHADEHGASSISPGNSRSARR
jgi:hypothetical protein